MTSDEPVRGYGQHPTPPAGPPVPDDRVPGDAPRGEAYGDAWLRPTLGAQTPASAPGPPTSPGPGRPARRPWLLAGLGAALLLMAGVAAMSGDALRGEGAITSSESYHRVLPPVLTIQGGANDIEVRAGGAAGTVDVLTRARCPDGSVPKTSWSGDTLVADGSCGGFLGWSDVDHVVTVPDGTAVTVEAGSGDVTVAGSLGATRARSGSGDVSARDVTGPLSLETGSGDVEASGLGRADVTATSGSGDVDLDFSAAPDAVRVQTGSGDASLRLPAGTYDVSPETSSGDVQVRVADSPSSADHVTVRTGSGDIVVRYG